MQYDDTAVPDSNHISSDAVRGGAYSAPDAARKLSFTIGQHQKTKDWHDVQSCPWSEFVAMMSRHEVGPKEGRCFTPAVFDDCRRGKHNALQIDVAVLDSDAGASLDDLVVSLKLRGLEGAVVSTHSHLKTTTQANADAYDSWCRKEGLPPKDTAAPARFLVEDRGMRLDIAQGAVVFERKGRFITFSHQPCPKYRVLLPLRRPWRRADYDSPKEACAAWESAYRALVEWLGIEFDPACADTARLFYLPRHPGDDRAPEAERTTGKWVDIFVVPGAAGPRARDRRQQQGGRRRRGAGADFDDDRAEAGCGDYEYVAPETGEVFDLTDWARRHGKHFKAATALRECAPHVVRSRNTGGKRQHILCPNADQHTSPEPDDATFVCDAGDGDRSYGFVINCRHAHCVDLDRLAFLRRMLEQGWLTVEDLKRSDFSPGVRPVIRETAGGLPEQLKQAEAALISSKRDIYQRGGAIVRPGIIRTGAGREPAQIIEIGSDALRVEMTQAAAWERFDQRSGKLVPMNAPMAVANALLQQAGHWKLPVLEGILTAPTLRRDGSVLDAEGYDPETKLLLSTGGVVFPTVPEAPTKAEAEAALMRLLELIKTFPFVADADRSVMLSALLTAAIRRSLRAAPLHGFSAPSPGTGKSMLVAICGILSTGQTPAVMAQGKTEEETEKRLGAHFMDGDAVIAIDNCEAPLGGEFLNQALTEEYVSCRVLGRSENRKLPTNAFITATGNNLTFAGDMSRRAIMATLDACYERPELRVFTNEPLVDAKAQRPALLIDILTVLRAYHVAGMPSTPPPLGSYREWSDRVRGALIWLGQADPVKTMESIREQDARMDTVRPVFQQWARHIGEKEVSTREIIQCATEKGTAPEFADDTPHRRADFHEALLAVAGVGAAIDVQRLGKWLGRYNGRIIGGLRIVKGSVVGGYQRWALNTVSVQSEAV